MHSPRAGRLEGATRRVRPRDALHQWPQAAVAPGRGSARSRSLSPLRPHHPQPARNVLSAGPPRSLGGRVWTKPHGCLPGDMARQYSSKADIWTGTRRATCSATAETRLIHYPAPRLQSPNTHGTGCTLSSAIATLLGRGQKLPQAVGEAKLYLSAAIAESAQWRIGDGERSSQPLQPLPRNAHKNLITKT